MLIGTLQKMGNESTKLYDDCQKQDRSSISLLVEALAKSKLDNMNEKDMHNAIETHHRLRKHVEIKK